MRAKTKLRTRRNMKKMYAKMKSMKSRSSSQPSGVSGENMMLICVAIAVCRSAYSSLAYPKRQTPIDAKPKKTMAATKQACKSACAAYPMVPVKRAAIIHISHATISSTIR
jgi:hypothetical protein